MADKLMNEPRAWRAIAEHIAAMRNGTLTFLCWHVDPIYDQVVDSKWQPAVSGPTRRRMLSRVKNYLGPDITADFGDEAARDEADERRESRVLAALWFALEAEDELAASSQVVGGEKR